MPEDSLLDRTRLVCCWKCNSDWHGLYFILFQII